MAERATIILVEGRANVVDMYLTVDGDVIDGDLRDQIPVRLDQGRFITAKLEWDGAAPVAYSSPSSGLSIVDSALGHFQWTVTGATINSIDNPAYLYVTVWNGNSSVHATGPVPVQRQIG
jgi:hypothetical protein